MTAGWPAPSLAHHAPEPVVQHPQSGSTTEPESPHATTTTTTEIHWAILRVDGASWQPLHDALAARLPDVRVLPFDDAAFEQIGGELFAYVEVVVEPGPDAQVELTIVLSDQRAYLRRFDAGDSRPMRGIATTVANTLVAIEQERIEADVQIADIPRPEPEPEPPDPPVEDELEIDPVVVDPLPPEPAPELPPGPAAFELGLAGALHGTFGLAPATVRGFAALAGAARISVRHHRGFVVEAGLRVGGRAAAGHRLWRNRLQLAAGYAWRRGAFALAAVAGPTIEPWLVRVDGAPSPTTPQGDFRATPLWGAAAAINPGVSFVVSPRVTIRLGLRTELAASVMTSGAAGRVFGVDPTQDPDSPPRELFTFGGLELDTGLEFTIWLSPPRSR